MDINIDKLIAALRSDKQRLYDNMVNGDSPQPAEVVDTVTWTLKELLPEAKERLYEEVLRFYPVDDYEV